MTHDQVVEIFVRVVGRDPGHNDHQTIDGLVTSQVDQTEIEEFLRPLATPPRTDPVPKPKPPAPKVPEVKPPAPKVPEVKPIISPEPTEKLVAEDPEPEDITLDDLKAMKLKDLKPMALELGIKGRFTKKELVAKIWRKL